MVTIREAQKEDVPEITALFRETVLTVNAKDYSERHIDVWSSMANDFDHWEQLIETSYFIVAEQDDQIVGFASLAKGHIFDHLFVKSTYLRRGIGIKLMRIIESQALSEGYEVIKAEISQTALPFFEDQYYIVEKRHKKNLKGMVFKTYFVNKPL